MTRWLTTFAAGCVLLTCGCGPLEQTWNSTPDPAVVKATPPADSPETVQAPAGASQAANQVHLSAGTSLPQSLPTGTAMHFSVDYRLRGKPASPPSGHFWVIQRAMGPDLVIPVQLKDRGTLTKLTTDWRPEQAPFRCFIAIRDSGGRLIHVASTIPLT